MNNGTGNYGTIGLPLEQEFWDYLMETSKRWGLAVYEQVCDTSHWVRESTILSYCDNSVGKKD